MPSTPARAVASQDICSVDRPYVRMPGASASPLVPLSRVFGRGRGTPGRATLAVGSGSLEERKHSGQGGRDERRDARHCPRTGRARQGHLRGRYRQMLFTTPGLGEHVSGVILFDETIRQATDDGVPFVKVLEAAGSLPGIKVDTGAKPLALFPGETVTEGLDGLRERLAEYTELGARFAKWRATILIGDGTPTDFAIMANAHAMARYAALCQEADVVPI